MPSCIGAFNEGHRKYLLELKQIMPVCIQQNPPGFVDNGQAYRRFWLYTPTAMGLESQISAFYPSQELSVMLISPVSINVHKSKLKQFDT